MIIYPDSWMDLVEWMACGLFRHSFFLPSQERGPCRSIKFTRWKAWISLVWCQLLNVHPSTFTRRDDLRFFLFALQRWAKRQDLIDQHVAYFLRKNPEVGSHGGWDDGTNPQDGMMQQKSGDRPGCRTWPMKFGSPTDMHSDILFGNILWHSIWHNLK
jgi:hypothetical protein